VTCGLVASGACAGALLRYGVHDVAKSRAAFGALSGPAAICTLNVVGSLVLGAVAGAGASPRASLLLGTGFCGAFTTFSTYSVDALTMLQQRNYPALAAYVIGNNVLSIGGAATGMRLGNAARSAVSLGRGRPP
jgi:CrcB protein